MPNLEKSDNYIALQQLCKDNIENLSAYSDQSSQKIVKALQVSLDHLKSLPPVYNKISRVAPLFDFDKETPGNGYRSFLTVIDKCLERYVVVNKRVKEWKNLYFFMRSYHAKEIEAYARLLASLCTCFEMMEKMYNRNEERGQLSLFSGNGANELLEFDEKIDKICFYGRCLGLQFHDRVRRILLCIVLLTMSYYEVYYGDSKLLNKIGNCFKYFTDPETRAHKLAQMSKYAGINVCKSCWKILESNSIEYFVSLLMTKIAINHIFYISPEELIVSKVDGSAVEVPIPVSHIGLKSIQVRLLSGVKRVGMVGISNTDEILANKSRSLIIHCFGGGYVSLSSKSHQSYLSKWTKDLDCPILSIDYSVAPEAPFPRALEEVVYVYGWVLKHGKSMLGTTLDKIIMAGDSSGANLCTAATLKLMRLNLRLPDGIIIIYPSLLLSSTPSPSRLLSVTDPVVLIRLVLKCFKAYAVVNNKETTPGKRLQDVKKNSSELNLCSIPNDPLVSPYLASDQELAKMPSIKILSVECDFFLDECVTFGKKLKALGVPVTLDILPGLAHGFLNFVVISKESTDATNLCIKRLKELIDGQ